jgi:hypothetical protein
MAGPAWSLPPLLQHVCPEIISAPRLDLVHREFYRKVAPRAAREHFSQDRQGEPGSASAQSDAGERTHFRDSRIRLFEEPDELGDCINFIGSHNLESHHRQGHIVGILAVDPIPNHIAIEKFGTFEISTGKLPPPRWRVECPPDQVRQRICADSADGPQGLSLMGWRSTFTFVAAIHSHSLKLCRYTPAPSAPAKVPQRRHSQGRTRPKR